MKLGKYVRKYVNATAEIADLQRRLTESGADNVAMRATLLNIMEGSPVRKSDHEIEREIAACQQLMDDSNSHVGSSGELDDDEMRGLFAANETLLWVLGRSNCRPFVSNLVESKSRTRLRRPAYRIANASIKDLQKGSSDQ